MTATRVVETRSRFSFIKIYYISVHFVSFTSVYHIRIAQNIFSLLVSFSMVLSPRVPTPVPEMGSTAYRQDCSGMV